MKRLVTTLPLGLLAFILTPRSGQACPIDAYPDLDCTEAQTCCVSGEIFDGNYDETEALCDDAIFAAEVADDCPGDHTGHQQLYQMQGDTWSGHGWNTCDLESEYGKHWMASMLYGGGIDNTKGPRHHPSDYARAAQAMANDYHVQQTHSLGGEMSGVIANNATFEEPNSITLFCAAFEPKVAPSTLGGFVVHESWHSTYGGHDADTENVSQDFYFAHDFRDVQIPLNGIFVPDVPPPGIEPTPTLHSVYQTEHEYYCDMVQSPSAWVPRSVLYTARTEAATLETSTQIGFIDSSSIPAWALCGGATIPGAEAGPLPGRPRKIRVDFAGVVNETSFNSHDDDPGLGVYVEPRFLHVSPEQRVDQITGDALGVWANGEVWIVFDAIATLSDDNDEVVVQYNVLFHEADVDDTHCDQDWIGDHCPGIGNPAAWPSVAVSSDPSDRSELESKLLNNFTADTDGADSADIKVTFTLQDWG